jgi:hypothetical protein
MYITASELWLRDFVTDKINGAETKSNTEKNGKKYATNNAQGSKDKSMGKI